MTKTFVVKVPYFNKILVMVLSRMLKYPLNSYYIIFLKYG